MTTKTLNQLSEELNKLVSEGLGERKIYLFKYDNNANKTNYEPFNYNLTKATVLDEALSKKEVNAEEHLLFQK